MPIQSPQLAVVGDLLKEIAKGQVRSFEAVGPWGSGKTLLATQVAEALGVPALFLAPGRIEAEAMFDDVITFAGAERAVLLPAWEVLPTEMMAPADDIVAERMNTLKALAQPAESGRPLHAVLPVRSLLQCVANRDRLLHDTMTLKVGEEYDLEELITRLVKLGYERELMVEQRGQMSVRGGIFDVFPIASELPYRFEFFGDEVESIRRFEPETQRSVGHVDMVQILPRSEKELLANMARTPGALSSILDYLPKDALIVLDEAMSISEEARRLEEQLGDNPYFITWDDARKKMESFLRLSVTQVGYARVAGTQRFNAPMRSMTWEGHAEGFWTQLQGWDAEGYTVVLVCNNTGERQRLFELLEERGYRIGQDRFDLRVDIGRLRAGFSSPADKLAMLSEREMFGRHYVRRVRRRFEAGGTVTQFSDLRAGDYVVHMQHGIGRYLGLRRFSGKAGDFLALQYSNGDKLYVPVSHIDVIQRYSGGDGAVPKIDKIGGSTWAKTKARVKKAVRDMTDELLKLYAARESRQGHAYSPDTPWQREFEDSFEYEETVDQARAITEVKRDMESARPMDRLICGDVGYGKTEVALRAAFKCVMDGKQVAVLVPTTVLAQQHYNTFTERMADYPVKIELMSRFVTPARQRQTTERLKAGEVDIVVGTHRITSKDLQFKDLGLVIIDEEQRFGVAQKERLKQIRTMVDVLTLTATPIPRTLNLSLLGVRDMSVINTAPNDRLPIHTLIEAFDERIVIEAIRREMSRQGQVFFVHNRVQTILAVADMVHKLVPEARIAVGHGQMHEHELENVMTAFINKEVDILVCTTIIGSGIDIPNANTIIVNNADHFGLSELYQLRGRVGRYKHRAFAYLLIPGDRALTEEAQKRLKALEEFSSLGAGFRIAMRDLEIRGSGNILGGEQHGHIAAVGYDTYVDLIAETVAEIKGEPHVTRNLPPFDVAIDAYIPEEYVPSEAQKITLYKRIAGVRSVEELDEMQHELQDRFGPPPAPVRRLLDVMRVRALAADIGAKRLAAGKDAVNIEFESGRLLSRSTRNVLAQQFGDRVEFAWKDQPSVRYKLAGEATEDVIKTTQRLLKALAEV